MPSWMHQLEPCPATSIQGLPCKRASSVIPTKKTCIKKLRPVMRLRGPSTPVVSPAIQAIIQR